MDRAKVIIKEKLKYFKQENFERNKITQKERITRHLADLTKAKEDKARMMSELNLEKELLKNKINNFRNTHVHTETTRAGTNKKPINLKNIREQVDMENDNEIKGRYSHSSSGSSSASNNVIEDINSDVEKSVM
jgi:hypothetical protein